MTHLICLAIMSVMAVSCGRGEGKRTILPSDVKLSDGDVVFRRGAGMLSHTVVAADGGRYSHLGIVVDSAGVMMVVHAVPDEPDYPGDPDRVKMETAERFFSSMNAVVGEVMRLDNDSIASAAACEALRIYHTGRLFDHDYDDSDTTRMYCSELVEWAFAKAGCSVADGRRHDFMVPAFSYEHVILPTDIYVSPHLRSIVRF